VSMELRSPKGSSRDRQKRAHESLEINTNPNWAPFVTVGSLWDFNFRESLLEQE
jgi:hypothetical protein